MVRFISYNIHLTLLIFIIGLLSTHLQISHYKNKPLDHSIHIYLVVLLLCAALLWWPFCKSLKYFLENCFQCHLVPFLVKLRFGYAADRQFLSYLTLLIIVYLATIFVYSF